MAKVTSKLQVTVPKAIADQYRIKPGDEIIWLAAGDSIRVIPARGAKTTTEQDTGARLRMFDEATQRQAARKRGGAGAAGGRGWTREDLYDRGRSR
jgi:AbrB family looped-hinge helix DNA binding protein